jgi:CheY-like chemotaxis protein
LAKLMRGDITVSSRLGVGSVFRVSAILQHAAGKIVRTLTKPRYVSSLDPKHGDVKILVVDDNIVNRTLIRSLLVRAGFKAHEACDGREALDVFDRYAPDAVLMDMRMPVMDGYEATRRIKSTEAGRATPVIVVTAEAFEEERSRAYEAGADGYLRKPVSAEALFGELKDRLSIDYIYLESTLE